MSYRCSYKKTCSFVLMSVICFSDNHLEREMGCLIMILNAEDDEFLIR